MVVVLGCGHPAEPPVPPKPDDGAMVQAEPDAATVAIAEASDGEITRPGFANPPAPTIIDGGRIVDIKQVSGHRQLEIVIDSRIDASQITAQWTAALVAGAQRVPGGELVIIASSQHTVRATLASDIERPERYRVRFYPPGTRP